jgi:hypothetical protein
LKKFLKPKQISLNAKNKESKGSRKI